MHRPARRYTRDHAWIEPDGELWVVGLTARAIEQLGELSAVHLRVAPDEALAHGQCFAAVESVKAEVELHAPLSGAVVRVNHELELHPERLSDDCYGEGWMIALRPSDAAELATLLDAEAYSELLKTAAHRV